MNKVNLISRGVLAALMVAVVQPALAEELKKPAVATVPASAAKAAQSLNTGKNLNVPKAATTGSVATKNGDNQYPSGQLPIPPKPKKEGLEAAGAAVKAKAAQP